MGEEEEEEEEEEEGQRPSTLRHDLGAVCFWCDSCCV